MKTLDEIMYHVAGHGVIEALADTLRENGLPSPPLLAIYQEGIARRLMKTDHIAYINAMLFGPLFLILQQHRQSGTPAVMAEVEKVLDLAVSAVLKIR